MVAKRKIKSAPDYKKIFAEYPKRITSAIKMDEPNHPILIYKGGFQLILKERTINIKGEINYVWFPSSGVRFVGKVSDPEMDTGIFIDTELFELHINSIKLGDCSISVVSSNGYIEGDIRQRAVIGDSTVPVKKIIFSIPNLREFLGMPVTDEGFESSKSRIEFENPEYKIIIDKCKGFDNRFKSLEAKGGYLILYNGEATKKKGNISFEESRDLLYSFSIFLNFLNGGRCSPLFIQGVVEDEVLWTDFTDYFTDPYKRFITWPPAHTIEGLNELWGTFSKLWKNPGDKDFLISAVHWYISANSNFAFSEGAIIMAQTALELIYNWLLIEKNKLLHGKDAESITAANKIRLLLSHVKLNPDFPASFTHLKSFGEFDAPEAFVQIRNALVHAQMEKRKKLTKAHYRVKYEASLLGIWYIEHSMLFILNYHGRYRNRCSWELCSVK